MIKQKHHLNSLVAQLVKNLSAMRETWVRSLGWEDPLEKGKATHSSVTGLENVMDCVVRGVTKSQNHLCNHGPSPWHERDSSCRGLSFPIYYYGRPCSSVIALFLLSRNVIQNPS